MRRLLMLNVHARVAILLLIIVSAVSSQMIITPGFLIAGDATPRLYPDRNMSVFYPMWNVYGSSSNFQNAYSLMVNIPFFGLGKLLQLSSTTGTEILLISILFLTGFCMYYVANKLLREIRPDADEKSLFVASIIPALVYMFCPKTMDSFSHPFHLIGYALAPLVLLAFMKSLQNKRLTYAIGTGFLLALAASAPTLMIFIPILLLSWLVYSLILSSHNAAEVRSHLKVSFWVVSFFLLFSAYWLLPYILASFSTTLSPPYGLSYETLEFLARNTTLTNVICLRGAWWAGIPGLPSYMPSASWLHGPWVMTGFLIPLFAFAALLLKSKNKYVIYFSVMSVIFVFLAMGTQSPFPSVYQWMVFNAPLASRFGWVFRESYRFVGLLAMTFSFLIAVTTLEISCRLPHLIAKAKSKASRAALPLILVLFVSSFVLYAGPSVYTGLFDSFVPVKLPQEFYQVNNWLSQQGEGFSVSWLPEYNGRQATWLPGRANSLNLNESSLVPAKGAAYLNYFYQSLLNNETTYFSKFLNILNVRYIIFHNDILGAEEEANTALTNLAKQNDLEFVKQFGFIYVFETENYAPQVFIPTQNLITGGGLDLFNTLNAVDNFSPAQTGLLFPTSSPGTALNDISNSDGILLTTNVDNVEGLILPLDNSILIAPFEHTRHGDPGRVWSGAMTTGGDRWQPYSGIKNWDFVYGKGVVFTWVPTILEEPASLKEKDLIDKFNFENENSEGFSINYPDIQEMVLSEEAYERNNSLGVRLYGSTWGWKVIGSPLIPASYGSSYRYEFYAKGEEAWSVHAKVAEYDANGEFILDHYVTGVGDGTFDWGKVSFDFAPESPNIAYMQLQIWHGHETKRPLPNKIWIDDVKVYDLRDYLQPNSLEIPFEIEKNDGYDLFVRYFQNEKGGKIGMYLDGNLIDVINTKDQLSKFIWKDMGIFNLTKGEHTLTLQNVEGFNAVNIFALLPHEKYENAKREVYDLVKDKRIIYVFEAESDLYRTNAEIWKEFGTAASSGEVLLFTPNGTAWQVIEVPKDDQYKIALRLKGSFEIKIDNQTFRADSKNLDVVYLAPIYLKEGQHELEVEPLLTLEPIEWDFETLADLQEWKGATIGTDIHKISLENGALKAELSGSTWGWKTINSPLLPASYEDRYRYEFYAKGEEAWSVHAKVAEYDANGEFILDHYVTGVGDGTFDWKEISFDFSPESPNIAYMQLQIWHGHETENPLPNRIWIDNVKVFGAKQNNYLDVIWIYSIERENKTLNDILTSKETPAMVVNYTRIDPTKCKVEVNATGPFMLAFTEAYDPLWVARVNGKEYKSFPLYSVINGFWIEDTGGLEITIEYKPQSWFYYGVTISVIGLLGALVYLTKNNLFKIMKWGKREEFGKGHKYHKKG